MGKRKSKKELLDKDIIPIKGPELLEVPLEKGWRMTYHKGKWYLVAPGKNVYLGWQVEDIGEPGFSDEEEVRAVLKEIQEDYIQAKETFGIGKARRIANQRLNRLALIVLNDSSFDLKQKAKLIRAINKVRKKLGFKEWIPTDRTLKRRGIPPSFIKSIAP